MSEPASNAALGATRSQATATSQSGLPNQEPSPTSTAPENKGAPSEDAALKDAASRGEDVGADPRRKSRVPEWMSKALKDPRSWKNLLRCWAASWVCFILLFPNKSLATLGQAAFFTCIVTIMIPSNMPVFIWLLANTTLVLGAAFGWAWSAAGMAASRRARPAGVLSERLQSVQSSVATATNPQAAYRGAIFRGELVQPASTGVTAAFFVVGCYFFAVIMAKAPKLKIFAIFGIIVMDIGLTYGPLFPAPPYTIPTIFMLPIGVALGVAFACMLLIFPETLSHSWTTGLTELLGTLSKLLSVHQDSLKAIAQDPAAARSFETKFAPVRLSAIDLLESLGGQQAFLDLEVSYARYSNKDLKSMYKKVALTTVRLMGIQAFHHFIEDDDINYGASLDDVTEGKEVLNDDVEKQTVHAADTARLHDLRQKMRVAQRQQGVELSQLLPKMEAASERLFAASYQCLHETSQWLRATNQNRWLGQQSAEQHQKSLDLLTAAAQELTEAVADFKSKELAQLIAPYDGEHFLTDETVQDFSLGCRPLHLAFVWVKNQERFALTLADFTREVRHIAQKHPRSKLWFPLSLRKLWKVAFSRHHGHTGGIVSAGAQGVEEPAPATSSTMRDLDSLPPSHVGHKLGRSLAGFYDFFSSSDGMFALRFVIGSIALWVPAVLPSSAGFVYQNRGIWALIMFQTGMASTSGELFFSIAARLLGTVIGLLAGAVCWYIGSGSGNGNPYGLAATMAVVLLPIMFFRLYAPPILLLPTMMCGVTVVLIVGYSWIDAGHLAGISVNSGIGIEVAWRRGLLVIIGMAVSVIIVLFPRPPSTRKQVRLHFAASTASILDLYESLMGAFVTVADRQEDLASLDETLASLRPRYVGALVRLKGLKAAVGMARLDLQIRGKWPAKRYEQMLTVHARLLESLSQLFAVLSDTKDDLEWRRRFGKRTPFCSPEITQDVIATLVLVQHALKSGRLIPPGATGSLLDRVVVRYQQVFRERTSSNASRAEQLTLEQVRDDTYVLHMAGVSSFFAFVARLDELVALCL
ncbi:hypothetical protein IE81DRAFT_288554 [Ceraceosorus guamensis]|uniref:ER transporter 6TM N-terminal domain-containing protein n=1 Tax=Ceraceosorus guamensis TaxID=1522189 RepID=A0A316W1X4_9BASI|nr:hypothetical protein IE81DRAFT_288554 [Ceraceosorus guamensis]PWN43524.1 hypothetical protein IE81DRAFT_288554 [Ceraceosorus guamensis]